MVLIVAGSRSQWTLARALIQRLRTRRATGLVWTGPAGQAFDAVRTEAEALDCRVFARGDCESGPPSGLRGAGAGLPQVLDADHPYRALLRRQIGGARTILREASTSLLIVLEDGPGGDAALIAAARETGVPVLSVPFGVGESRDYDNFLADKHAEGALNVVDDDDIGRFLRAHAPHWIRKTPYGDVVLFPDTFVAARMLEGLDLPQPWTVHGGHADRLAVESPAMRRIYRREGVPEAKLADVGTVYCDEMRAALDRSEDARRAHETGRKIAPDRTSLLVSLPPSYHATRADRCDAPTYREMCRRVLDTLTGLPRTDVTMSIHPATDPGEAEAIRASGLAVTDQWMVPLIPLHDIFLTDFSSTIRWAITAGKPVVNYDAYGFGLDTYAAVDGVKTFRTCADAAAWLRVLCDDDAVYEAEAARIRAHAADWGTLDGRNVDRLFALMEGMERVPS